MEGKAFDNAFEQRGADITPQELRGFLFFWERLVIENVVSRPLTPDSNPSYSDYDIFSHGHRLQTRIEFKHHLFPSKGLRRGFDDPAARADAKAKLRSKAGQYHVFTHLEAENPGRWAVAESEQSPLVLPDRGRALLVKLHRAVPIPDMTVKIEEILEFREKRRPELLAFRHHADQLFLKIGSSADAQMSFLVEFENLARSITDLIDSMEERQLRFRIFGLQAKVKWEMDPAKWTFDPFNATAGAGIGAHFGLEAAIASALALPAVVNVIPKVEIESASGLVKAVGSGPLQYAFLIHDFAHGHPPRSL
ncbi:hypothetical protein DW352_03580 [Pseudolabrys taiwanensis]|uniref:Uncharacterized protein n=1 Tax=Pseudolabrys taiwanensis TaxID=331696 RepID=A0A345ZRY1_9HYPH|nr:DUF6236 family protein [Pseudolabrys taiwanensis]AXK79678.1 hypothetical protein DW352_03580 [Pseudolabrys taiwanensis]